MQVQKIPPGFSPHRGQVGEIASYQLLRELLRRRAGQYMDVFDHTVGGYDKLVASGRHQNRCIVGEVETSRFALRQRLGGIDHGTRGVSCTTWWSKATSVVERSVFLDDLVYSIAGDRVKVQRMGRFGEDVADIALTPW